MSSIGPIGMNTFLPIPPIAQAQNPTGAGRAEGADNASFSNVIARALDGVQGMQDRSNDLAAKAATGELEDIHDLTLAQSQAQLSMDLTLAVRNRALESYQEIMRMQA